jgi:23S rRNA (uridine2552-2'-O)-methyltransferase
MARSKTSKNWLKEHFDDEYVIRAQQEGYRSRASYKLLEINDKDRLLKPGMVVIDLGAAPGGWTQIVVDKVTDNGKVIAVDILEMDPVPGAEIIIGDFREDAVLQQIMDSLNGAPVDLVLSDMAPNTSGVKTVDQPRMIYLAELTLELARSVLKQNGTMCLKIFQGEGFDTFLKACRQDFKKVISRKPKASRARSREIYLLAQGYKL